MIYTFFTSVFLTFFFALGAFAFMGFVELWRNKFPLNWTCFQHVFVLAIIAVLCLIAAFLFGSQIPFSYGF